jgi:four helix bundle protein
MTVRNFRDLIAWQKGMDFTVDVYQASRAFPKEETYGLRAQVRESAVSIPANIAEGHGRDSSKEFARFLSISHGSLCETQTHILLAERLDYLSEETTEKLMAQSEEVARITNSLKNSIKRKIKAKRAR